MNISYMLLQIVRAAESRVADPTLQLSILVVMQGRFQVTFEVCSAAGAGE